MITSKRNNSRVFVSNTDPVADTITVMVVKAVFFVLFELFLAFVIAWCLATMSGHEFHTRYAFMLFMTKLYFMIHTSCK